MFTSLKPRQLLVAAMLIPLCGTAALFNIDVSFDAGMDDAYKNAFNDAVTFWESNITGYRLNSELLQGVSISATVATNDGPGGVLGSAGPTMGRFYDNVILAGDVSPSYVLYASAGSMTFDSADVDNLISAGVWEQVIRHEMAHVLGFGTLWGYAGVYNNFYVDGSGEYTGAAGLAAYQAEFDQPDATFVPVELEGGAGTSDGHWDEAYGGAALTGITDADGNDMRNELMTGWLNSPTFLSDTTLGQFYDLGYTVVPEPATVMMMASLAAAAFWIRRRISYLA